jgi:hypothetical protein
MTRQVHAAMTVVFGGVVALTLAGCASQEAKSTEQLLAAADFQVRYADTPQKLAKLEALTQRKLVAHQTAGGGVRYVYADAAGCKCVYAGDEKAYQEYQRLRVQENIAGEQEMTAEMNRDAAMDWGLWRPWAPYPW